MIDGKANKKLWDSFKCFFREIKGYEDWTDFEISMSMNNDDVKEYIEWVKYNLMEEENGKSK